MRIELIADDGDGDVGDGFGELLQKGVGILQGGVVQFGVIIELDIDGA